MTTPNRLTLPRLDLLFDAYWYRTAYPDLAVALNEALDHYLLHGVEQRRDPHPLFDTAWYLGRYADVAASGINPLQHYLEQGASRGYDPHPLFDSAWYMSRIPHAADDVNALLHYLDQGAAAGLDPNPFFDTDWYLAHNPDVAAARLNPLVHFVRYGAAEGRDPNPLFDLRVYRERYPALAAGGINPLTHFLHFVRDEGLSPMPPPPIASSVVATHDAAWLRRHRWDDAAEASLRQALERLPRRPLISVVLMDTHGDASDLLPVVGRLADQIYTNWEVCAFVSASRDAAPYDFPIALATYSQRVTLLEPLDCENEAGRLRAASVAARGDHILLMRSTCRLAPAALAMLALRITSTENADLIYFDHDHCTPDGRRHAPEFKPDWSPELLLSYPYPGPALCVSRRAFISAALRVTASNDETSLHDLALCVTDQSVQVAHIAALLCQLETSPLSDTDGHPAASRERVQLGREGGSSAVRAALERRGLSARVDRPSWARDEPVAISALRFEDHGPRVAIIIPTRNQVRMLRNLIESLARTSYEDYSVLVVDNASDDPETLEYLASLSHEVVRIPSPQGGFNFAFINNAAVRRVDADYVLFLNDDTEVITPGWLSQMVGYLGIAGVGAVGAKLLFPDGRVQHAGVLMGIHGGKPGHAFGYLPADAHGYLYYADVARNYLAVTAACMLTPKQLFLDSGGFDEQRFAVAYNDVDYCLRLGELGYRIVYCPTATLLHHEGLSRSRVDNPAEEAAIARRAPLIDPYYNPNLTDDGRFTPRADGTAWIFDEPRPAAESVKAAVAHTKEQSMSQATADSASRATIPVVDRPTARIAPRASDETPGRVSHDRELEALRSRLDACQIHLNLVLTSTSWRLMAPLRLSVGLLRGEPAYRARLSQLLQRISPSRWLRISQGLLRGDPLYRQELDTRLSRVSALRLRPGRDSAEETETPASRLIADYAADEPVKTRIVYVSGEPRTPGHRYRVERYAAAARSAGAEAQVFDVEDAAARLDTIGAAQVLVIWRAIWSDALARIIIAARGAGARIIFDVDDLMIDPEVATLELIDGIRSQGLAASAVRDHYARMREVALAADLCTCPTEPLAEVLRGLGKPTLVLRNGFDAETYERARSAVIARRSQGETDLIRLGYAAGTRTHQRDFRIAAPAVAHTLREYPKTRLVLFHDGPNPEPSSLILDLAEFAEFTELEGQIEWRPMVSLEDLPSELARFDINLAPLEVGNPYCEAKSELKFFEAALVGVPTVASPTAPFRAAIEHGCTGYLAASADEWLDALTQLVTDPRRRHEIAREALHTVLWRYGPEARADAMSLLLEWGRGAAVDPTSARRNDIDRMRVEHAARPYIPPYDVVFLEERATLAEVAVIMPVYNYAHFLAEALESVKAQTLAAIELVVIDDCSTDDSLAVARHWLERNAARFQRVALLRNRRNSFLGSARNAAIACAEAPFVMPLDPDNMLLPECLEACLGELRDSLAAMAYPLIQQIGDSAHIMGTEPWSAERLRHGNYIDAMALLRKSAWAAVGGYENLYGWEDYDLWCKFVERGFWGLQVAKVLALYRVHKSSMLRTHTHRNEVERKLYREVCRRHPWLDRESLRQPLPSLSDADTALIDAEIPDASAVRASPPRDSDTHEATCITPDDRLARLAILIDLLRCPLSGERLRPSETGEQLISESGRHVWTLLDGRPILFEGLGEVKQYPDSHRSNPLCERANALIAETRGPVLNLSAGGSAHRKHHVIEVEAALFCNTDVVADAHYLPFADACFELVIAMNAFEHYADPARVAREIHRVLAPGGRVFIHTAFLQPLHEPPYHFYNCTRYGLTRWFADFDALDLRVSDNFTAGYAISWLLSETEALLRAESSGSVADAFAAARVGDVIDWWRHPPSRDDPVWRSLTALPQRAQEQVAAGFEYLGRKG